MILEYKARPGTQRPSRANPSDAGLDVFYCPVDPKVTIASIKPGENQLLSTGLSFGIPHGYMLQVCNRSSIGAKRSLVVGAHIIDSGYAGEIFVDLHNIGNEEQFISTGDKIAQLVLVPVIHFKAKEIDQESGDLYEYPITISDRGTGTLGSTNKLAQPADGAAHLGANNLNKLISEGWEPNGF
jgi:dUTP pyrophosphatase|tara:strand:- start:93 stop:644 length:552 start_codon:yes stop_codon:yes gene_type:complete